MPGFSVARPERSKAMRRTMRLIAASGAALVAVSTPVRADDPPPFTPPPTTPHVGFYTVHPRVGRSTYFSLSASWPHTQAPLRVVAKLHPAGERCGANPKVDTGTMLASAWLTRDDHHVVWKDWTPTANGAYLVCTWLGNPAIATGAGPLLIEPKAAGASTAGALVAAATNTVPDGPPRAVFPTAPAHVYARFALRGVERGRRITIEFRDTNGHIVLSRARSHGPALTWYRAAVSRDRIAERLGYWLVSVRVGDVTLGRIHFLVPAYAKK